MCELNSRTSYLQCDLNHDGKISMEELAGLLTFWMIRWGFSSL